MWIRPKFGPGRCLIGFRRFANETETLDMARIHEASMDADHFESGARTLPIDANAFHDDLIWPQRLRAVRQGLQPRL